MAIYDFMSDLGQLRNNYASYDEKRKSQLDNLKNSIETSAQAITTEPTKLITEPPKKSGFDIQNMFSKLGFGANKHKEASVNSDGLTEVELSNKELGDNNSGWSDPNSTKPDFNPASGEKPSNFLGTQGEGEGMALLNLGMSGYNTLSTKSDSIESSLVDTGKLTLQGAQAGMAVGGPIGAGVGAAVGLGVGLYDTYADNKKKQAEERNAYDKMIETAETKREQDIRMKDGEQSLSRLTELRKAQLNYIS